MGRNIVVLSDGTGNSAAKLAKTNVWRTYQAIEFDNAGNQLGLYDNGVGTSTFKPLAVLGGAFGWGLKRNVLSLYKFLCRNYRPGDRIYGFGFSRGAFTIRVLMGLALNQGLVRWHSEEELAYLAECAYRQYRAERYRGGFSVATIGRFVRDLWIGILNRLLGQQPYTRERNQRIESIEFLGLWDTVDAYGMPVRELKLAIDEYLWPLYFDSVKLSARVKKACHALALDDERATFHPLVWDESDEPAEPVQAKRRVEQVWFAGVHSNVGGGYPDDALSYVSLLWMLERAKDAGLALKLPALDEYRLSASAFGRLYDSRGGLSSYYRYAPRRVETYSRAALIDPSVELRIRHGSDQYAPIALPAPPGREADAERVWDTVWWRRVAYWLMVAFTGLLVLLAWRERPLPRLDEYVRDVVGMMVDLVAPFVPAFLDGWLAGLRDSPAWVAFAVTGIVATYFWGRFLETRIRDRAARIWRPGHLEERRKRLRQSERRWQAWASWLLAGAALIAASALLVPPHRRPLLLLLAGVLAIASFACALANHFIGRQLAAGSPDGVEPRGYGLAAAHALRTSGPLAWAWHLLADRLIPLGFALLLVFATAHALNRVSFMALNIAGHVCRESDTLIALALNEQRQVPLRTDHGCFATGILVERGALYQVELRMDGAWHDAGIPVSTLAGFSSSDDKAPWYMGLFVPMRRHLGERWFKPIAHVGGNSLSEHVLAARTELRDGTRNGELFIFVNDAVIGLPGWWDYFYGNNTGTGVLVIRKIRDAGEGR